MTTPQRLVGIELKPGPTQSSSSNESASPSLLPSSTLSASTFFRDGLHSIFAFLDLRTFVTFAASSRYYFSVASSMKLKSPVFTINGESLLVFLSSLKSSSPFPHPATTSSTPSSSSSWSLASLINRLTIVEPPWYSLRLFIRGEIGEHLRKEMKPGQALDYSPLHQLTRMQYLVLRVNIPEGVAVTQFCRAIGAMKSLETLSLDLVGGGDFTSEHIKSLALPQLLSFQSINARLNYETLESFSCQMPLLERLDHTRTIPVNVSGLALFSHLRAFTLYERSTVLRGPTGRDDLSTTDSNEVITILSSSRWSACLTHLQLRKCIFAESLHWIKIAESMPSLTSLDLERAGENITTLCQANVISSSSTSLIHRIRILKLTFSKVPSLLSLLGSHFTSLTHLHIIHDFDSTEPRSIFHVFNDAKYLPQLKRIEWMTMDYLSIVYDEEARINCVKFDHQAEEEKQLDRTRRRHAHDSSVTTPPAGRLVGIELNPGPPVVSAAASTSVQVEVPAAAAAVATLFFDGLASIFLFLDDVEWIQSSRVSHHWFSCASTGPSRQLAYRPDLLKSYAIGRFAQMKLIADSIITSAALFYPLQQFNQWLSPRNVRPYSFSLRHHITRMKLHAWHWKILENHINSHTAAVIEASNIQPLHPLHLRLSLTQSSTSTELVSHLLLPSSSLTALNVNIGHSVKDDDVVRDFTTLRTHELNPLQYEKLFSAISQCYKLRTFHIEIDRTLKSIIPIVQALVLLKELETLSIKFASIPNDIASQLFNAINSYCPKLISLTLSGLNVESDHTHLVTILRSPKLRLRVLNLSLIPLTKSLLESIHSVQPHLCELRDTNQTASESMDVSLVARLFCQLDTLQLSSKPQADDDDDDNDDIDSSLTIIRSIMSLSSTLTRLEFFGWNPDESQTITLVTSLPHLSQLSLTSIVPLNALSSKKCTCDHFNHRLSHLSITTRDLLVANVLDLLPIFTSLHHLQLIDQCDDEYNHPITALFANSSQLFTRFDSITYLPHLTYINIDRPYPSCRPFYLIYDRKERLNECQYPLFGQERSVGIPIKCKIRVRPTPATTLPRA